MRPDWNDIRLVSSQEANWHYMYWWWFILGQFDPEFTVDWAITVKKEKNKLLKLLNEDR